MDKNSTFNNPEWDSGESYAASTSATVPSGKLNYSTTYYWRVRYKDNRGAWSVWSSSHSFTTRIAPAPIITWNAPDSIVYGTALSGIQLNATVNTAGTFVYDPPAGQVPPAGTHTLTATFAPDDDVNWTAAEATVELTVTKAPLIAAADNKIRTQGDPNPPLTITYTGLRNAEPRPAIEPGIACAADETSPPGFYPIILVGGADPNYILTLQEGVMLVQDALGAGFELSVRTDATAPTVLWFGEAEGAAEGEDEWDEPALPDQVAWLSCPFPSVEEPRHLARDFRPLADLTRWRLEVGAPSLPQGRSVQLDGTASPETRNLNPVEEEAEIRLRRETSYTLTWDVDAADAGREVWLQQIDALERPVGFPLDMKALDELPGVSPGTVFEIVYGALREFEIPLARGWNAVGTPLLTLTPFGGLSTERSGGFPAWRWNGEHLVQVETGDPFPPKTGHLVLCLADSATLKVTGLPPDAVLPARPGWDFISPVELAAEPDGRSESPMFWEWDAERQTYRAKDSLHPGRAYWRHAGEAATTGEPVAGEVLRSARGRESEPDVPPGDLDALVAGNTAFALDLYYQWREEDGNLFLSPHSLSIALGMTYAGARNRTASEMSTALRFELPDDRLHAAFNALDLELASRGEGAAGTDGEPFRLRIVNQLWGERTYSFLDGFLDALAEHYGAGMRLMDFIGAPEPARLAINDWVAYRTEQRIRDLLPEGSINNLARLVLTNAIYFNAAWQTPFDEADTSPRPFTRLDGGQIHVPTMRQRAEFRAVEGGNFQAVELPYDGGELSMLILLPEVGALADFERALDPATVRTVLDGLAVRDVDLALPVFEYSSKASVKPFLSRLGMVDAFTEAADFSGMDGTLDLLVADVVHQAFVKVDEKGTEAAAATGVVVGVTSHPEFLDVHVDRPFLFLIRDHATGAVLFLGRVLDPEPR